MVAHLHRAAHEVAQIAPQGSHSYGGAWQRVEKLGRKIGAFVRQVYHQAYQRIRQENTVSATPTLAVCNAVYDAPQRTQTTPLVARTASPRLWTPPRKVTVLRPSKGFTRRVVAHRRIAPRTRLHFTPQEYTDRLRMKLFPEGPNDPRDIQSGCKICWLIWEEIYQKAPDFAQNVDYYHAQFEWCLRKYNCPPSCYTNEYCHAFEAGTPEQHLYEKLIQARRYASFSATIAQTGTPAEVLSNTLTWADAHRSEIQRTAEAFDIPPELLEGLLMSEMYWDYGLQDAVADRFAPLISWLGGDLHRKFLEASAPGLASVHFGTYKVAYEYLEARHKLPPGVVPPDELSAAYLVTSEGSIQAAALVTLWLVEQYEAGQDAEAWYIREDFGLRRRDYLTAEDMAIIYAAYRQGTGYVQCRQNENVRFENWVASDDPHCELPGNAQFALPFMAYTSKNER